MLLTVLTVLIVVAILIYVAALPLAVSERDLLDSFMHPGKCRRSRHQHSPINPPGVNPASRNTQTFGSSYVQQRRPSHSSSSSQGEFDPPFASVRVNGGDNPEDFGAIEMDAEIISAFADHPRPYGSD